MRLIPFPADLPRYQSGEPAIEAVRTSGLHTRRTPLQRGVRCAHPPVRRSAAIQWCLTLAFVASPLTFAVPARAASAGDGVATVVIAAATFPQPLAQTLPTVSVLTRVQIEQSGVQNLATLLQRVAGVQITSNGGPGHTATVYLEGFGGTDAGVLVLLDGVPITSEDASGGGDYLENLTTDQIERIEIVHGNVSAIYGSGAIGGVILITTREGGRQPRADLTVTGGTRNTVTTSANAGGQFHQTHLQVGISRYTTAGIPSINPAQSSLATANHSDGYHNLTMNASLVQDLGAHQQLGARALLSDGRYSYQNEAAGGHTKQSLLQIFSDNRIEQIWTSSLGLSRQRTENINLGSYPAMYRSTHLDALWRNVIRLSSHWTLTGGATHQHQSVTSTGQGNIPSTSRNVTAVFAGLNGSYAGNAIQLNARHDQFDGYASTKNTYYIGYGRQLGHGFEAIVSDASAFNVPPLGYLYYQNPYWAPNPQLKPESAHTVQAALQWSGTSTTVRATAFQTVGSDLWGFGSTPLGLTQFQNVARTRVRAVELSARGTWRRWSYDANVTLQQPLALSQSGHPTLQRLARSMANLSLEYDLGQLTTGLTVHYSGPRPDVAYSPTFIASPVTLGSYTTVELTAAGPLGRTVRWRVRAENLLDKQYETAYGYNSMPFGFFVGLTWRPFGR
jgi:vitamin B12 transporter